MQKYTQKDKEKFDEIFWNKNEPSQIEIDYLEKTQKYIGYIKWIPGIKMVWIGNSLAMNSANKESDIDLLIVTDVHSLWVVRIFCTFIFQIMWVRKTASKHAWRMCLSFFCTLKWLDFWKFCLEKDPYLYFWILYFRPILDYDNTYDVFLEQNSSWADYSSYKDTIQNNKKYIKYSKKTKQSPLSNSLAKMSKIVDWLLKKLFLPKTLKSYEKIWKPFWVIINDDMLKFHNWDIRKEITEKF